MKIYPELFAFIPNFETESLLLLNFEKDRDLKLQPQMNHIQPFHTTVSHKFVPIYKTVVGKDVIMLIRDVCFCYALFRTSFVKSILTICATLMLRKVMTMA